jgi:hypothetical protein
VTDPGDRWPWPVSVAVPVPGAVAAADVTTGPAAVADSTHVTSTELASGEVPYSKCGAPLTPLERAPAAVPGSKWPRPCSTPVAGGPTPTPKRSRMCPMVTSVVFMKGE